MIRETHCAKTVYALLIEASSEPPHWNTTTRLSRHSAAFMKDGWREIDTVVYQYILVQHISQYHLALICLAGVLFEAVGISRRRKSTRRRRQSGKGYMLLTRSSHGVDNIPDEFYLVFYFPTRRLILFSQDISVLVLLVCSVPFWT